MHLLKYIIPTVLFVTPSVLTDLKIEKDQVFKEEMARMVGHDIVLSEYEQLVNQMIMDLKVKELEYGFANPRNFTFFEHFFKYKDKVKDSKLFQLLKKMPKGALLHAHDTGILNADYVLSLTYWDNLYVCFHDGNVDFRFAKTDPNESGKYPCGSRWQLMKDARAASGDVKKFDDDLKKRFGMVIDNPDEVYSDINLVWVAFQSIFIGTGNLVQYKPVWEQYFYDTLKALREDGIMYFEIRSVLPSLYDLDGKVYDAVATAETYKRVADKFVSDFPDFLGAKLIYAPLRQATRETVQEYLKIAREIKKRLPCFLAGFDLVGQEDLGQPLKMFLPEFIEAKEEFDLFFHAGETNWNGMSTDENLFDAISLGAKRIGHGYSIIKHPVLMEEIKKRDIAIEVNLISNNVLKLVKDIRNHPLASWLALDLPLVLSSDDPGLWDAEMLTHDFHAVFLGVASRHADLRLLKKLALNSLRYSTYPAKERMFNEFEIRWKKFIESVLFDAR